MSKHENPALVLQSRIDVSDFCTIIGSTSIITAEGAMALNALAAGFESLNIVESSNQTFAKSSVLFSSTDDRKVYGINGQSPFFTASQVFLTSTGLRAIDAPTARLLAPDMNVGFLRSGHVVYQLRPDRSAYDKVQINSIEGVVTNEPKICLGVQTSPASFHGNGFLLFSVQPDMTIPSIGAALSSMSQQERIDALKGLKELDPLFQRLGRSGVEALLQHELHQKQYRLTTRSSTRRRPFAEPLTDVKRTYDLHCSERPPINMPDINYKLPQIALFENVLIVDGDPNLHYNISSAERTVRWTRELRNNWFEHGSVRMFEHGLSGTGALLLTQSATQVDIPKDKILMPVRVVKSTSAGNLGMHSEDSFKMTVDMDSWPRNTPKTTPTHPLPFGIINILQQDIGGGSGLDTPIMHVPVLDSLCQAINVAFPADGTSPAVNIESLYYSTVNLLGRSERTSIVTMKNPALLAQMADPFDIDYPFNITFKNKLGSDLVLPVLFQEFSITISDDSASGALYQYNPTMRGSLGLRHLLTSETIEDSDMLAARARTVGFVASRSPLAEFASSETLPAPVTTILEEVYNISVEDALDLPDYSDVVIHSDTQDLIRNAMLYHMDDKQRTEILKIPDKPVVPIDLSYDLGDGLARDHPRLRDWLADVYAPAYICNQLSQVDPSLSKDWNPNFTEDQKLKIKYWWSGRGATCLANAEQYTEISQIASASAMLRKFPKLKTYQLDSIQWSRRIVECLSDPTCLRSLTRTPIEKGVNYANLSSNVIAVLDPRGEYTSKYFNAIFSHTLSTCFRSTYIRTEPGSTDDNRKWLKDTVKKMGVTVLGGSFPVGELAMSSEMKTALLSDITNLEANLSLPGTGTPEQRMQQMIDAQEDLIEVLSTSMSPFNDILSSPQSSVDSWIEKGQAAFAWVQTAYDKATAKLFPKGSANAVLFKGFAAFAMVAKYLFECVTNFSEWNTDSEIQKQILIFATLQSTVECAEKAFAMWMEWKTLIDDRKAFAQAAMLNDLGDVEMETFASSLSKSMEGLEGPNATEKAVSATYAKAGEPSDITVRVANDFERPMTQEVAAEFRSQQIAKYFGSPETWFGLAQVVLSIGMVISMSMQLADQWNDLNTFGKTLSVIQIAVTALTILCNETITAGLIAFEIIAAEGTMSVVLPGIGSVLAAVGILISLLFIVFDTRQPPPSPPPSPIELFIRYVGIPLVDSWDAQPAQRLDYTIPRRVARSDSSPTQFLITATNNSGAVMFVPRVTFTFLSGPDPEVATLFEDSDFSIVGGTDIYRNNDGNIYTGMSDDVRAILNPNPRGSDATSFDLSVTGVSDKGKDNPQGYIRLLNGFSFSVNISGFISTSASSLIQIVEHLIDNDTNWNPATVLMTN